MARKVNKVVGTGSATSKSKKVSSGANRFTELDDTPNSYAGEANKFVRVDATESFLEFVDATITLADLGLDQVDNTSDLDKPVSTATQTALDLKLDKNTPITADTKTKITYDSNGLVTLGEDATTADIVDTTNRRYVTDADQTTLANTSGTNTGDQTSIVGITGTAAEFDTAVTDDDFLYDSDIGTNVQAHSSVLDNTTASFTTADETKLDGISAGATVNSSDATLLDRANHTGTQTASTISNFDTEVSNNTAVSSNTSKVSADGSIDTHSDVDTTTSTPSTGDIFTWNGTNWVPTAPTTATGLTTDDITEASNLYYTELRVSLNPSVQTNAAKVSADGSINTHSDVDILTSPPAIGEVLIWDGTNFVPGLLPSSVTSVNGESGVVTLDTDDVDEGTTNLYFTDNRADARVDLHANLTNNPHNVTKAQVGLGSVDNTSDADKPISSATQTALNSKADQNDLDQEITNRTNADIALENQINANDVDIAAIQAEQITQNNDITSLTATASTALQPGDNLSELVNDSNFQTESQVDSKIANVIDSAPGALDTLNELAEALGDDANYAATVANQQAIQDVAIGLNTAKVSADGSVTSHSDVSDAGSGQIITAAERAAIGTNTANISANTTNINTNTTDIGTNTTNITNNTAAIALNTAKVSADGSVTSHSDVTDAGSGAIITTTERNVITNFATNVLSTVLAGLSTTTNAAITATDTVLGALGKLQAQINNIASNAVQNHSELTLDDGTNPHGTTKADVGLGNVDNTSDLDKSISTATQAALDLKYDASNPSNYVDAAGASTAAPVQDVNGQTGNVVLDTSLAPNVNDTNTVNVNSTTDIIVKGGNFDPSTTFTISGGSGTVTINSTNVTEHNRATLNITTDGIVDTYNVTAANGSLTSFGSASLVVGPTVFTPGDNVNWENVTPGLTTGSGTLVGSGSTTWNTQATFGSIPANTDGSVYWTFSNFPTNMMLGLNSDPATDASYTSIDFAIYVQNSSISETLFQNGNGQVAGSTVIMSAGEEFEMRRTGSTIALYRANTLLKTFSNTSTAELHFDCSIYSGTVSLTNVRIELA